MNPGFAPSAPDFHTIAGQIHQHALTQPSRCALAIVAGDKFDGIGYGALDARMDRVAAVLQQAGLEPGQTIAMCASTSIAYVSVFLGALRCGVVVASMAPNSTREGLARTLADASARLLFTDAAASEAMGPAAFGDMPRIALDNTGAGLSLDAWLAGAGAIPTPVVVQPDWPFNIIYSSGTTGMPKGIVQSHGMRWAHVTRNAGYGYGVQNVTLLSTPLYSNTTLPILFTTMGFGGTVLLMVKFDAPTYLQLAQIHRVTHTMLVPVQYQRLMRLPDFDHHDLSSFRMKFSTSAPFGAALKADVLRRWPGGLVEIYGMTEGGGTCMLDAHLHPGKLHTVGRPIAGHDIRLIDDDGCEVASGETGEIVGHSNSMMTGYHGQPDKTREAEWFSPDGKRFIRTGDIGRFDEDGFLTLFDRKKDMIISGGFNIYPSDLETQLSQHPAVSEVAVVGVPSAEWGETPVAFVVTRPDSDTPAEALRDWLNQRVGKTQRLADLRYVPELPRSAIGKVLKRELRESYGEGI